MAKIILNKDKCMGCGLCANLDAEHFGYENMKAVLKGGSETSSGIFEIGTDEAGNAENAANLCPVGAITIE
jgi:ferredoxin